MKQFSANNTLNEIVSQTGKEMCLFFSPAMMAFVPEEYYDIPLSEWAESFTLPWGMPFPWESLVDNANLTLNADEEWDWVSLWGKSEFTPGSNDINSVALMIPKCNLEGIRPAAIICPGGAYENLDFASEGYQTAKRLQEAGYRCFVLKYRYSPNRWPLPQADLALAIKYVRANAAFLEIDPANLMLVGYSAGGHLCASTVALRDEVESLLSEAVAELRPDLVGDYEAIPILPDKLCLGYPVISFLEEAHEPSFQNLSGGDESLREHLSVEKHIDPDYPKTFVWTCADDGLVPPSNAARMDQALTDSAVPHMFRIYPQGDHGCALAIGTSAEGWISEMLDYMK